MIISTSSYNPMGVILAASKEAKGPPYSAEFMDMVKKELFLGGVVPETDEEFQEMLALLFSMEII